jgi:Ion channel
MATPAGPAGRYGVLFAAFYAAIDHLDAAPFLAGHRPASTQTFQYFSFTTLTTLGYGDFTAAGNGGRAVAVIEALVGQVFLAPLVARLVAAFRDLPNGAKNHSARVMPARRPGHTANQDGITGWMSMR